MPKSIATDKQIEERYESGTLRLSQEKNDFLLPQVLEFVRKNKWINIHPEYQRRLVWDRVKRSAFIESLLMNIPIPPIFLLEWEYSRYEVMDGQQRLSSIVEFYENRFKLSGLEYWPELNGKTYGDCPPTIQRGLDRRRISAVVLLAENLAMEDRRYDIRRIVFERLNTGGQNLNAQELRNCVYSGLFNDLLVELAGNDLFDDLWEIPRYSEHIRGQHISAKLAGNSLYSRMRDCEIVLRFFAMRDRSNIRGSMKVILDRFMHANTEVLPAQIEAYRQAFIASLTTCHDIFGDATFRVPNKVGKPALSQPLYDAVMIAADNFTLYAANFITRLWEISKALAKTLSTEAARELIVARPNTADAIRKRLDLVESIFRSSL